MFRVVWKVCWHQSVNVENPRGRTELGTTNRKWEDRCIVHLGESVCEDVDLIHLAQDRIECRAFVNTVMNTRFFKKQNPPE